MSRRQKIVVAAVAVVLVLLYTGAAVQGGSGQASNHPGGLVGWLGSLIGSPPAVARADLSAPCLDASTLTVKGHCALTVAPSSVGTRQVKLTATDAIRVTSRPPSASDPVANDVDAGAQVTVTVDGDGGDIALDCAGTATTCTATLTQEQ